MRRNCFFLAGLLLITFACLWPAVRLGFIGYDDLDYVYQNPAVQSGLNSDSIVWAFGGAHAGNWHPVTWLSHMLDCELFGLNPQEEHWVNLILHAVNVLLVFYWLVELTGARWRSFFVAAFFAVHPQHVQSVAWISERKDVLSGFFFMATLISYTRYCRNKSAGNYVLVLVSLTLGLMAKPMLVSTPLVLLLIDFWPLERAKTFSIKPKNMVGGSTSPPPSPHFAPPTPQNAERENRPAFVQLRRDKLPRTVDWTTPRRFADSMRKSFRGILTQPASTFSAAMAVWKPLVREKVPMFLLCMGSCLVTLWAQSSGGAMDSMQQFPLLARCLHAVTAYSLYLWKMLWPVNLAILYPLSFENPNGLAVLGSVVLLSVLFFIGIWRRKEQPYLLVGWMWFFIMLLPVIGLVQVGLQAMADRYTYLPSIGLFIAVVWRVAEIAERVYSPRTILALAGATAVIVCGVDARYQLGFWRDNITLFRHVIDVSPENDPLGYFYLGISYAEIGKLDSAEDCLRQALRVNPKIEMARSRLGNVLLLQKKYVEAEPLLETGAKLHADDVRARATFGMALAGEERYAAAQAEFEAAQRLDPNNAAVNQLAIANAPKAQAEVTVTVLSNELKTNSTARGHASVAMAQSILGHYLEAVQEYKMALAAAPDQVEYLNNLAWLLATCPDTTVRNGGQAVTLAQKACELTQFKKTIFIGTLAAAYAESGQFDTAVLTAKKACDNANAAGEMDLLQSNQRLLSLYQSHEAYHETAENP